MSNPSFLCCIFILNWLVKPVTLSSHQHSLTREKTSNSTDYSAEERLNEFANIFLKIKNTRKTRSLFSTDFAQCMREVKDSFDSQNQTPLEFLAKKFQKGINAIKNSMSRDEDDPFRHVCRLVQSGINTAKDISQDQDAMNTLNTLGDNLNQGINELQGKGTEIINSREFFIGCLVAGIIAVLSIVGCVAIKCRRSCKNSSSLRNLKNEVNQKGQNYEHLEFVA